MVQSEAVIAFMKVAMDLWFRTTKNIDGSTEPLARPFAHSLAPLAHFAHSLARGKVNF